MGEHYRDDYFAMTQTNQTNIYGEPLTTCCTSPMTGFFRTGCCETSGDDTGVHTVCAVMTDDFLGRRPLVSLRNALAGSTSCGQSSKGEFACNTYSITRICRPQRSRSTRSVASAYAPVSARHDMGVEAVN
jgi:hypothetical protein